MVVIELVVIVIVAEMAVGAGSIVVFVIMVVVAEVKMGGGSCDYGLYCRFVVAVVVVMTGHVQALQPRPSHRVTFFKL